MPLQNHLATLERRHEALDVEIEKESVRPSSDENKLCALKKKKLRLKDEISRLKQGVDAKTVH